MNLEIESHDHSAVVRIKEEKFSYPMLGEFFDRTSSLIDSGAKRLVIDLSNVRCLDSASLGCLMDIAHMMSEHNGTVQLVALRECVGALLSMVGLTNSMEFSCTAVSAPSARLLPDSPSRRAVPSA